MAIVLDKNYFKPLDEFFAKKTIHDVNRDTYLICNLHDMTNKIYVSLVFLRDWDSLETDTFNQVIIQGKGVVFTFPAYWISVPKELAYEYFTYIIQAFYNEYVSEWLSGNNNGSSNNSNVNTSTNCGCNTTYTNAYPPCGLNV